MPYLMEGCQGGVLYGGETVCSQGLTVNQRCWARFQLEAGWEPLPIL